MPQGLRIEDAPLDLTSDIENDKYNAGTRKLDRLPAAIFDWDDTNRHHLARHALSPQEAEQCNRNDPLIVEEQFIHGELRYMALGETSASRRLAFVFTVRGARVRFVTAYAMTPQQQEIYEGG
jgi:uncharacterized DUF497 family protein